MNLQQASLCGRFKGQKELVQHLEGKLLSYKKACLAKCFECMGGYADGAMDCKIPNCPVYPRMPYRGKTNGLLSPDPQKS